jgi:hypothetical protein
MQPNFALLNWIAGSCKIEREQLEWRWLRSAESLRYLKSVIFLGERNMMETNLFIYLFILRERNGCTRVFKKELDPLNFK